LLVWLAVLNAAAVLTQPRSVTLVLPSLLLVLLVSARERGWRRVTPLRAAAVTGGALTLVAFAWASVGSGTVREFASYLWQFYLPRLGFMNGTIGPASYDVHSAFLGRLVGGFAELEVGLPPTPDTVVWWAVRLGLLALVVALVLKRDAVRRRGGLAVVLAAALFTTVLGLHLIAYRALLGNPNDPIITGRYLLPFVGLLGVAVALAAYAFPRALRPVYTGLVLAAMAALQLMSLGLLLGRFYG
jgi:hypothetical protein